MKRLMPLMVLTAVVAAGGCGRSDGPAGESAEWKPTLENPPARTFKSGKPLSVPEMAADDVIVAVNGAALTRRELDMRLSRYRWFLNRNRGMEGQQKQAAYRSYGKGLVGNFIRSAVVVQAARRAKVADEATVRREVEKSVELTLKQNNLTREKYDREVPGGLKAMAESLEDAFWTHAYLTNNIVIDPQITAELVSNIVRKIDAENAVINASNAVVRARLEAARKRITVGKEDFGKVADEVSEDDQLVRDGTGYYGTFDEGTVLDEEVRKKLFALDVGQVSDVIEEDDGFSVYKATDYVSAVYKDGQKTSDARITLARIWMAKEDVIVPAFSNDPVEDMRRQNFNEQAAKLVDELRAKATIVYPHGTNFWPTAAAKKSAK